MTFLQAPTDGNVSSLVPRFNAVDSVCVAQLSGIRSRRAAATGSRRTIADMWNLVGGEGFSGVSMVTKEFESSSVAIALTDAMSSVTDKTTRFRPKIGIILRSSTLNRSVGVVIPAC